MREHMTTREFIRRFINGDFNSKSVSVQCEAGWYDWFCRDTSLMNKTKMMGNIIKQIKDGGKVDLDKTYVFFKNNCPCGGNLYDDFRICDIETGNVFINVNIANPYDKRYAVYGRFPEGEFWSIPYVEFDGSKELVAWLNEPFGEFDNEKKLMMQAHKTLEDVRRDRWHIDLEDMSHTDEGLVLKILMNANKIDDYNALVEAFKKIDGYVVETSYVDDSCGERRLTVTFKKEGN